MKKHFYLLKTCLCALAVGVLAGCSAEVDNLQLADGMGAVKLSLNADTGFETTTKAVDESSYRKTDLYTVQILQGTTVVGNYTGATIPDELIELTNGSYTVKAFYGEDVAASLDAMRVEGSKGFDVQSNQVTNVEVSCAPVCAKVNLTFEGMDKYFSDWETRFKTVALNGSTYIYEKDFTGPLYLKVNKEEQVSVVFELTPKEGQPTEISKTYTMNPNQALNIAVKPSPATTGNLGITISIDGSTNDETIDIEIPSDWI